MKLTIKEASSLIGETPNVLRNWVRDFKDLIPFEKGENGYNLFPPEAVEVLRTIQHLHRKQGYSIRQIEHHLISGGEVAAAAAAPDLVQADELQEVKAMLAQLMEQQAKQQEFNQKLIEQLDKRDKQLTDYITERRQERLEQVVEQKHEKQSWINKIFGKGR